MRGWSDFLDDGASGWWLAIAPGSGIFLDAGRALRAPSKIGALMTLLEEWERAPKHEAMHGGVNATDLTAELVRACGAGCSSTRELRQRLARLERREASCADLGWDGQRCIANVQHGKVHHVVDAINDKWDGLLIGLARASMARYDTLVLTSGLGEIVDLRLPSSSASASSSAEEGGHLDRAGFAGSLHRWLAGSYRFGYAYKLPPVGIKSSARNERIARMQVEDMVEHRGAFSLREPRRPDDEAGARPCKFDLEQPTIRLVCAGHVSWLGRGEA